MKSNTNETTRSKATLKCVETLIPPISSKTHKPISKIDQLLSSYSTSISTSAQSPVWNCTWSHDGTVLATCQGKPDPCVRLWKYKWCDNKETENQNSKSNWTLMATLREEGDDNSSRENSARTIRAVAFAPTPMNVRGILAVASFDGTISIWEDFSSESGGKTLQHMEVDVPLDIHNNSSNVAASALDRYHDTACGWECTSQLEGHENEVKDVAWNATGTLLASCGRDKSVWIWECFLPGTIGGDGNGSTGPSGGEGDFECLAVLQSHGGDVKSVVFAPSHGQFGDGDEILLSASYDDTIRCWAEDAGDWYCALTLEAIHTSTIWTIALSPGGVRMVSGSADKSLAVWRCYTASEKKEQQDSESDSKNIDNEGMNSDGLWKCVGKLENAHSQSVYSVDCAPSRAGHGRIVSGGGDDCINVYREVGGTSDAPLFVTDVCAKAAHKGDVNCVKWHPTDGRLIASAGDDGLVKIWSYEL